MRNKKTFIFGKGAPIKAHPFCFHAGGRLPPLRRHKSPFSSQSYACSPCQATCSSPQKISQFFGDPIMCAAMSLPLGGRWAAKAARMRWNFRATTQGRPYIVTSRLLARKAPLARPVRRLVPLPKKSHDFSGTPLGLCDINSALRTWRAANRLLSPIQAFPLGGRWVLPKAKLG